MRHILLLAAFALAGCTSTLDGTPPPPPPMATSDPLVDLADDWGDPELRPILGTMTLGEREAADGRARLEASPEGLWCDVVTSYVSPRVVCTLVSDGRIWAQATAETQDSRLLLLPGLPQAAFHLHVQVFVEEAQGNTTHWASKSILTIDVDPDPELEDSAGAITIIDACDSPDDVESYAGPAGMLELYYRASSHDGRPFAEIPLQGHDFLSLEGDGNVTIKDGILRITGPWEHYATISGTLYLDIEVPEGGTAMACGQLAIGHANMEMRIITGAEGLDGRRVQTESTRVVDLYLAPI